MAYLTRHFRWFFNYCLNSQKRSVNENRWSKKSKTVWIFQIRRSVVKLWRFLYRYFYQFWRTQVNGQIFYFLYFSHQRSRHNSQTHRHQYFHSVEKFGTNESIKLHPHTLRLCHTSTYRINNVLITHTVW